MTMLAAGLYDWLLFLHIVAAMVWFGGLVALVAFGVWMVLDTDAWGFGQTWIWLALVLFGAAFLVDQERRAEQHEREPDPRLAEPPRVRVQHHPHAEGDERDQTAEPDHRCNDVQEEEPVVQAGGEHRHRRAVLPIRLRERTLLGD